MNLSNPATAKENIDAVKVDTSHHEVIFENDQVRVVRWIVAVGDKTLNHSHPDNLNIALTEYNGKVTQSDGISEVHAEAGSVTWRQAGIHAVENMGNQPMEGIIVEPRQPSSRRPAGAPDPVSADPKHHKVEFENERIRVLREHREPGKLYLHGHPDNVQVLLTDSNMILTTPDGKTESLIGKAGDVHWRPAAQHEGVVRSDKPVEQILVEMKG